MKVLLFIWKAIKRLVFIAIMFPLVALVGVFMILSLFWWLFTGKDLLWVVPKIQIWVEKKLGVVPKNIEANGSTEK